MSVVVGVAVQNDDAVARTPQDKIFVVILRTFKIPADKALIALSDILHVSDSPRRPKILMFQPHLPPAHLVLSFVLAGLQKLHSQILVDADFGVYAKPHRQRRQDFEMVLMIVFFGSAGVYIEQLFALAR